MIIQGNTVQWHNVTDNAPGYKTPYGDPPAPTYLTTKHLKTVAWTPRQLDEWDLGEHRFRPFCRPERTPGRGGPKTVTVTVKHARGPVTIYQQPSAAGVYRLIVDFNDESFEGASWYEVSLEYTPAVPVQLLGVLEGMTNSMAYALNAKGQATGESYDDRNLSSRAFVWDPKAKVMRDLGTPAEWTHSAGEAINQKGQVAGELSVTGLTHIFIWDPIQGMQDLTNLGGNVAWVAQRSGLNDQGYLCGTSEISPGGPKHAFRWDPKNPGAGLQDLGTLTGGTWSRAYAINSKGQVAGTAEIGGQYHACLWDPKNPGLQDLGTLPGGTWSDASGINSKGQVVGEADIGGQAHAFLWDPKNPGLQDLGTLGGKYCYPTGINSKGQVVVAAEVGGQDRAFLWDPKDPGAGLQDLGTLGGTYCYPSNINSKGQVCGSSTTRGRPDHAFLWDPKKPGSGTWAPLPPGV